MDGVEEERREECLRKCFLLLWVDRMSNQGEFMEGMSNEWFQYLHTNYLVHKYVSIIFCDATYCNR